KNRGDGGFRSTGACGAGTPSRGTREFCWRRGRDSNPRYGFPYTRFPSERLKPLGHLSVTLVLKALAFFCKDARDARWSALSHSAASPGSALIHPSGGASKPKFASVCKACAHIYVQVRSAPLRGR